jgi:hypothetical protein
MDLVGRLGAIRAFVQLRRTRWSNVAPIAPAILISFCASQASAIEGPGTTTNTDTAIGQVGDERGFGCTGTLIGANAVLTAAHCMNTELPSAVTGAATLQPHFQRMSFGPYPPTPATTLFGLGVQAPNYSAATNANDIGVMLLLTSPAGVIPDTIATPAQNLAAGNLVSIVGYGRNASPLRNSALVGTAQVGAAAGDITATTYRYPESVAGPNVIQKGDSGGPTFRTFFIPTFPFIVTRIVGVHSLLDNGNPLATIDTRVNAYNTFLNGGGIMVGGSQKSTFDTFTAAADSNFNTNASWSRGVAPGAAQAPQDFDVAIINPGAARTVTVNANTANLEGLLNGINSTLNVAAGNKLTVGGATGVLNGGALNVAATATFTAQKLDNPGRLTVTGNTTISGPMSNSSGNGMNGAVTLEAGASFNVAGLYTNMIGAATTIGPGAAANKATGTFSGGILNNGAITVNADGVMMANGAAQNAGQIFSLINTPAEGAAAATAIFRLNAGGQATFVNGVLNAGRFVVKGVARATGPVNNPAVLNQAGATLTLDPATFEIDQGNLENQLGGVINGSGTFLFAGAVNYINTTTDVASPEFDTRLINFTLQGATTQFEATGDNPLGPVFGLNDPFSIGALDLTSDSRLTIENARGNHATPGDVLFADTLSIDSTSTLDIRDLGLWVSGNDVAELDSDIASGLIVDSLSPSAPLRAEYFANLNATTIVVPETATWIMALIGFAGLGFIGRQTRRASTAAA